MIQLPHDLPPGAVYVASASDNRADAASAASVLRGADRRVVSTWHDLPPWDREKDPEMTPEAQALVAMQCIHEIEACDVVLALGHPRMRGALVEVGLAIGSGKRVVWVGDASVSLFSAVCERGEF